MAVAKGATTLWVKRYNGPFGGFDAATSIVMSPDGSRVFVTGGSVSQPSTGIYTLDYATVAYDSGTGSALWSRRYSSPLGGDDAASAITVSPDGSKVFVTGSANGGSSQGREYVTVAYDSGTGVKLWLRRSSAGGGADFAYSIAASSDGSKVFVTGESTAWSASQPDYLTVAYDALSGAKVWVRRYDGPANGRDIAVSVSASSDGSKVYVTGFSTSTVSDDVATVAYDASTGATLWVKRYNDADNGADRASAVTVSPDGSKVFVTGSSIRTATGDDFNTIAYEASTGARLWVKSYDGPANGDDYATSIALSPDGTDVFVTGTSAGTATTDTDYTTLAYDASTGERLWMKRYDGPENGNDFATSIAASPDGSKVFVTGCGPASVFTLNDYSTVAYDSSTGIRLWIKRYNGPGNGDDCASSIAASPSGSKVFVTGNSPRPATADDYLTIAYAT